MYEVAGVAVVGFLVIFVAPPLAKGVGLCRS